MAPTRLPPARPRGRPRTPRNGLSGSSSAASRQPLLADPVARMRCLRGIETLSAATLQAEVCDFRRFATATPEATLTAWGQRTLVGGLTYGDALSILEVHQSSAMQDSPMVLGVIGRRSSMEGASIVPNDEVAWLPTMAI